MIGLMVLGALLIYGLILLSATAWMHRTVKKSGSSTTRSSLAAAFVALLILAPVFWDAIPTYIAFKYYSQKEAGLKVFKTLEQWKAENPGVAETLTSYNDEQQFQRTTKTPDGFERWLLNERFAYEILYYSEPMFLSVLATRKRLVDIKTKETLATYTEIRSGNSGGVASGGAGWWKPWLVNKSLDSEESKFDQLRTEFKQARGK